MLAGFPSYSAAKEPPAAGLRCAQREQCLTGEMQANARSAGSMDQQIELRIRMPRITRKTFVAAPAETVWKLAGDFAEWHPKLRIYADGPEASPELVVTVVSRDESRDDAVVPHA